MNREPRDRNLVLVLCYGALFLNISATISSFILTDNLGELEYNVAKQKLDMPHSHILGREATILKQYGASASWNLMLYHCMSHVGAQLPFTVSIDARPFFPGLITFYSGILSLIMSVLSYVWLVEARSIASVMSVVVGLTLLPTTYLILLRPFFEPRESEDQNTSSSTEETA